MELSEGIKFDNRYLLKRRLGEGSFGEVWLAEDTAVNNILVAVKIYLYMNEAGIDDFKKEYSLAFNLHHSNLLHINYFGVCERRPYLVMPYCPNGSASKFKGCMDEAMAWRFIRDVASGLACLHAEEPPMIHQDIKPDNVLIDERGNFLISDFGISKNLRSTISQKAFSGTIPYSGPERFGKKAVLVRNSDIWALGASVYELVDGNWPFGEHGGLIQRSNDDYEKIEASCSDELQNLIYSCLQYETWDRPSAEQLADYASDYIKGRKENPAWIKRIVGSDALNPNWDSSVTTEQKRILGALIDNMVAVKGGTFWMGAQSTDPNGQNYDSDAFDWESPVHRVTLSDYNIGKYEVTQEEWQAVMGKNPSYFKGSKRPVEKVSYKDCQEFIRRLNALTGLEFMLPTEAQWEYAARGGNMSKGYKYSGSNDLNSVAWYTDNSGSETHPVGQKQPNELGLYDMTGNVWEWCSDWYGSYSSGSQTNPTGPSTGSCRVDRGGCWNYGARYCRVSDRNDDSPDISDNNLGLRLVCP